MWNLANADDLDASIDIRGIGFMPESTTVKSRTSFSVVGRICNIRELKVHGSVFLDGSGSTCGNSNGEYTFSKVVIFPGGVLNVSGSEVILRCEDLRVHNGGYISPLISNGSQVIGRFISVL